MKEHENLLGTLYLIPTPLGGNPPLEVLPLTIKRIIEGHNHFIIENDKMARRFIKKIKSNSSFIRSINSLPTKNQKLI